MKKQSWSIIIFCYNEAGNLEALVHKVQEVLDRIASDEREVIIVDDGSSDNTYDIARKLAQVYANILLVRHEKNKGIGGALRSGYAAARLENVFAIPGDGQFNIEELLPFEAVPPKTIISFYRTANLEYSVFRNYLSLANKKLNQWLLGMRMKDVNWVKVYKRDDFKQLDLRLTSSLIESEICSKLIHLGVELREVESKYQTRVYGQSTGASFRIIMLALKDLLKLSRELRSFRSKLRS